MARLPKLHQSRRWFVRSWGTDPMSTKESVRDGLAGPAWHPTHLLLLDSICSIQLIVAGIFLVSFRCCPRSHSASKPVKKHQDFHFESLHYHLGNLPQYHCPLRSCAWASRPIFCCYGKSSATIESYSRVGSIDTRSRHLFDWYNYRK